MHYTALEFGRKFFNTYVNADQQVTIVDIGSQDVNGSLRELAPLRSKYVGVDFIEGKGVDIVISDPYHLPFDDESIDICVCSSCFEHSEFFWLLFIEALRILKPNGILYLNVPSNGNFHRHPVDCWRFYPDSGIALQNWARFNKINAVLLESFVANQKREIWNDFIGVFLKNDKYVDIYKSRIIEGIKEYRNGYVYGGVGVLRFEIKSEDQDGYFINGMKRLMTQTLKKLGVIN